MTTQTQAWSSWSSATISLDTLASANYVGSSVIDLSAVNALDIIVQALVVVGTVSGNKRCPVFLQVSNDNSTYSTGPTSGTTTTDEPDLYRLGDVPCNTSSATHTKTFPVLAAIGFVPKYSKVIVFNDTGAALSTGCSVKYATLTGSSA